MISDRKVIECEKEENDNKTQKTISQYSTIKARVQKEVTIRRKTSNETSEGII